MSFIMQGVDRFCIVSDLSVSVNFLDRARNLLLLNPRTPPKSLPIVQILLHYILKDSFELHYVHTAL